MHEKKKAWPRLACLALLALLGIGIAVFLAAGLAGPPNPRTPAGPRRQSSVYVPMADGTRLAVRIGLPPALGKGERVGAVMETTRYGTKARPTFLLRAMLRLGLAKLPPTAIEAELAGRGLAFVAVDARGSGSSFGRRDMEFSREEAADLGAVIDWIGSRPWSNGRVASYGISFSGNTAEIAAASGHPALAAAAPLYPDFDPVMHNAMPGGILNVALVRAWSESNLAMDANQGRSLFLAGTAPVDGDRGGRLLKAAITGHRTIDTYAAVQGLTYADDLMAPAYPAWSLSPWSHRAGIEASAVPLYVRVGWMDASTVNGALERFLTYSNPQTLVIGPWSHGGFHFYDPFLEHTVSRRDLEAGQARELADFLQPRLGGRGAGYGVAQPIKTIRYYTFGEGAWKTATTWPVPGFETRRLWFAQGGRLSAARPAMREGADSYAVDYSATTGPSNRWHTNLGGGAVLYPDRRGQDARLLCYTSEALATDLELTGLPVLTLNLSANTPDAAIFAYLEDVAPDGRVTYITEGELRALHRRISTGTPPHAILGPYHSMERKDGSPLEPGRNAELQIALQSTSVLLRKGHRIRVAIAGQDAASFARIPGIGDTVLTVERNGLLSSWLELPARARE